MKSCEGKGRIHLEGKYAARARLDTRVADLVRGPDRASKSYASITRHFEFLAGHNGWLNMDGSVYPVSVDNLRRFIAFNEKRIAPQSQVSYLAALHDKHEQLGFLEWSSVRFDLTIQ